ncbi:hypothetical protein G4991_18400 [Blautia obeum]|nr:hypothetical protein [Blautia obeum]
MVPFSYALKEALRSTRLTFDTDATISFFPHIVEKTPLYISRVSSNSSINTGFNRCISFCIRSRSLLYPSNNSAFNVRYASLSPHNLS